MAEVPGRKRNEGPIDRLTSNQTGVIVIVCIAVIVGAMFVTNQRNERKAAEDAARGIGPDGGALERPRAAEGAAAVADGGRPASD